MRFFLFLLNFFIFGSLVAFAGGSAGETEERAATSVTVSRGAPDHTFPSKSVFFPQVGCACQFMPVVNLARLMQLRAKGGSLLAIENFSIRKVDTIAHVSPIAGTLYGMLADLNRVGGAYAKYFQEYENSAVLYKSFVDSDGEPFHIDTNPLISQQKAHFAPFQAIDARYQDEPPMGCEYVPVLFKREDDTITSVYEHRDGAYRETKIGPEGHLDVKKFLEERGFFGFESCEVKIGADLYCPMKVSVGGKQMLYCMGIFEQWLFSVGIDRKNKLIDATHPLYPAYTEYREAFSGFKFMSLLTRENFLEYQIAKILEADPILKARATRAIDFCFTPWKYYNEAHILKEGEESPVPASQVILNEALVLGYYFGSATQSLHAASVSTKAFNGVLGIDDIDGIEKLQEDGVVPSGESFIEHAFEDKFSDSNGSFSFISVWTEIKRRLLGEAEIDPKDYLSFSGHGVVYVFGQKEFMEAQRFENRKIVKALGFNVIDSYNGNVLDPFYRMQGTIDDML